MDYIGKWYFLLVFFSVSFVVNGQNGTITPDVYDQFFQNYYLVNPANTDTSEVILNVGHRAQLGVFSGIRQTYFDANFRIKTKSWNKRHNIGVQLFNNSEGDFFTKNRAYLRYSLDLQLSELYFLSAGASFGMVSYAFKATQSSAGGADFNYDGSLGVWLIGRKLKVGASMQQIFQKTLSPIGQTFELQRVYNGNVTYAFYINHNIELTTHFWYKYLQYYKDDIHLAAIITLQDLIEFGANYRYEKGFVLLGGLKDIRIGSSKISIAMSYSTDVLNYIAKGDNAVEIFLKYHK